MNSREPSTAGVTIAVLFGPLVWAAHFLIVYGGHAVICAREAPALQAFLPFLLHGASFAALAILTAATWRPDRVMRVLQGRKPATREAQFLRLAMRMLALLSSAGVFYAWIGIVLVAECAQFR